MTPDVNTIEAALPTTIPAYVVANPDDTFTIVLNSRMTFERRMQSYWHELKHIQNGDYERHSADFLELRAHGLK
mgnify:CR=1 FL=1